MQDWNQVEEYIDSSSIDPSYFAEAAKLKYPRLAFSLGQLASKFWLLNSLYPIASHPRKDWVILGSWIGSIVPFLHKKFIINRVYGLDSDPEAVALSEEFNRKHVEDSWKYKGVVADVSVLSTNNMEFVTSGELIQIKPQVVINTSCEHMDNHWFDTADSDQLIVMQTNNYHDWHDHINTCNSVNDMKKKYKLSKTLYAGCLELPIYNRYMQIGYK